MDLSPLPLLLLCAALSLSQGHEQTRQCSSASDSCPGATGLNHALQLCLFSKGPALQADELTCGIPLRVSYMVLPPAVREEEVCQIQASLCEVLDTMKYGSLTISTFGKMDFNAPGLWEPAPGGLCGDSDVVAVRRCQREAVFLPIGGAARRFSPVTSKPLCSSLTGSVNNEY
ncbi:hypothetical protein SRHO_G00303840 [Serrasalmus rhombeus]